MDQFITKLGDLYVAAVDTTDAKVRTGQLSTEVALVTAQAPLLINIEHAVCSEILAMIDVSRSTYAGVVVLHAMCKSTNSMSPLQRKVFYTLCLTGQADALQLPEARWRVYLLARMFVLHSTMIGVVPEPEQFSPTYALSLVYPLRQLIRKVGPHLTPLHGLFALVCNRGKAYEVLAAELATQNPFTIATSGTRGLHVLDVLMFYFYSGLAYSVLKQWQKAQKQLLLCLAVPAETYSAVQIQAMKKLILVSLLGEQEFTGLPRYIRSPVSALPRHAEVTYYSQLGRLFSTRQDNIALTKFVTTHEVLFVADGNYGLVKQCMVLFTEKLILGLTRTYVKLSLQDIMERANVDTVEATRAILQDMIEREILRAKIDMEQQTVSFLHASSSSRSTELNNKLAEVMQLTTALRDLNTTIVTSPAYVKNLLGGGSKGKNMNQHSMGPRGRGPDYALEQALRMSKLDQ